MRELGTSDLDLFFLVKGKGNFAVKSKYCKKYIETKTIEEGYRYLLENYKEEKFKPIIIISSDEIITFVDQNKDEIEKYFIVSGTSKKGNLEKYIDKNIMTALAEEVGILCPKSKYMKWNSSLEGIEYPCLIKPSHQKPGHYNEFKFKICKNKLELQRTLKYVRKDSVFILQQYIPKKLDLLIYGCRMSDGKTIIAGAFIRDRWADSGSSSHGYFSKDISKYVEVEKIEAFLEKIDYNGLFSVEYGLLEEKAYFFEINLRNDGTSHYFYQAGANLPLAYVYDCAGLNYSEIQTEITKEEWFIDEIFDIENVILGKISRKKWKKEMSEATIFKYYDQEDRLPFEIVKKQRIKQIVQDIVLKRFRLYIVFLLDKIGLKK